jgi:glutathione S-transferase
LGPPPTLIRPASPATFPRWGKVAVSGDLRIFEVAGLVVDADARQGHRCFTPIERETLRGPWVMGGAQSIPDALGRWTEIDGLARNACPPLLDRHERIAERPAVKQRALESEGLAQQT